MAKISVLGNLPHILDQWSILSKNFYRKVQKVELPKNKGKVLLIKWTLLFNKKIKHRGKLNSIKQKKKLVLLPGKNKKNKLR